MQIGGFVDGRVRALLGVVVALGWVSVPAVASAVTFTAACSGTTGDVASLIAAIGSANASPGPDTVTLGPGCTYTLTVVNNNWYGPDGLPAIASDVTIEGNGATIARSAAAPRFRLFFVGADPLSAGTDNYVSAGPGVLTLRNVTLTGGLAEGGDSDGGGGGAGMGGAIFSQGVVAVDHSTIVGNTAQGGSAVNNSAGLSGGGIGTDSSPSAGGGFGAGAFGGGVGGGSNSGGGGGGGGFRVGENGASADMTGKPGTGGGPLTGTGGFGGNSSTQGGAAGGDGGGGGGRGTGADGGAFGAGGTKPGSGGGSAGGGVGGGGSQYADVNSGGGGGGFGGGGGTGSASGGSGGFGGGGGYGPGGGGGAGFGGGTATTTGGGGGGAGLGGAIFNMQGRLTIVNSTLVANAAVGGADNVPDHAKGIGGAVFNLSGSLSATASTFADNTATYNGASIYNLVYDGATARTAQTTLTDTVVADAPGPFDLVSDKPSATEGAANLGTATADASRFDLVPTMIPLGGGTISGSPLTGNPLLGPLNGNGGPTQTMAPATGSPVIDAGGGCPATDQRGQPRPDNRESACDIGAYEVQDPPAGGGGGGGGGSGSGRAIISGEKLSPTVFAAAPSGASAVAARRRFGTKVSYTLNLNASVRFTVVHLVPGRRANGSRCVKATRRNRRARRCTLLVAIRGSFTLPARAGVNTFRFTGRLGARKLIPGSYRLIATPIIKTKPGRPTNASFRIIR